MNFSLRFKLSFMMFFEYFIKGAWFVTLGTYLTHNLQASGFEIANIFSTHSLGAVAAPFFIGLIADKYFNAEKLLGVLHLFGALLLFLMYRSDSAADFYPYVLAYFIAYMSSLALSNAICFRHLAEPRKQFPAIRVWGTVGWIIAGIAISYVFHWDKSEAIAAGALKKTFLLGCFSSLLLAIFSFTLPQTPPVNTGIRAKNDVLSLLGFDALGLLKQKDFLIFFVSAILICIPLAFYYQNANPFLTAVGLSNPTAKMALGQFSEALCLLFIPFFFAKLGYKKTILVGIAAWVIRYLLFAYGDAGSLSFMFITAILLHGVCYDFLFVVGQIYTDTIAGERYRSSAQGLVTIAMYGIGMLIGFWVAGFIAEYLKVQQVVNFWKYLWISPAIIAAVVFVLFLVFFKDQRLQKERADVS
ncbi:MFS transporter [Olivibacter sp. XZL3]|uniref:MFS transporter n=1 Tax=Olivibacter sp. XZL3 TaxID=1735116 RepID=UPI001067054D|nr:MFS transporter [Olivibacter sp. XZL3]